MKKYNVVLFDLDGTLTNPKEGITKSVQYALNKMGIVEENRDELTKFIGPPLVESFQRYYDMPEPKAWEAIKAYREYFVDKGMLDNQVYLEIPELLQVLTSKGCKLAVATTKPTIYAEQTLEHFGLASYFSIIIGSNLDGSRVDKKEIIQVIIESLGVNKLDDMVMIGDRKHDIIGAKQHNIDSIGVLYGFGSKDELEEAGATYIVPSVEELASLLGVEA
ncbi:MAG TPA: HAD family hydrolase [Syntrophomonadaceae bacterium]|nr:HAD family hydrolase [Syntrophomonadaceae bacterium]